MRYLLDEGLPPDFASQLNRLFYPEFDPPPVVHSRDLRFLGIPDPVWIGYLAQRIDAYDEQWTIITRDRMRQHAADLLNSPLVFALLSGDGWARARKPDLWQRLSRYWPLLQLRAALSLTTPATPNVFRLSYYGRLSDYILNQD